MSSDRRVRGWLFLLVLFAAAPAARAQQLPGTGVLLAAAPMYLAPDATRTPLTTLPEGATVRVLARDGDWYRVTYQDRYLGNRTGYVLAANIRIEPPPPPGTTPPPRPAIPGQVAPPTETAQPVIIQRTAMKPQYDTGYVSINGTYQRESTAFNAATTFTQNVETAQLATDYRGVHSRLLDVGGGQRVWRHLSAGVALTWSSQFSDAAVAASLPHPFTFNTPRSVTGVATGVRRRELGLHFSASVVVPAKARTQVLIFGGPSFFRVTQGLITTVNANEVYPYDTATFGTATIVEARQSRLGAHVGADASVLVAKSFGLGAIVRYSRARVPFTPADGIDLTIKAGGLHVGGGLRFRF